MRFRLTIILLLAGLCASAIGVETDSVPTRSGPYKGYTGTVHQFGFLGGMHYTANPNYAAQESEQQTYHDYGLGVVYTLHDYLTRQVTVDLITSFTVITAKALETPGIPDENKKKIIWPVDVRLYLGPSEDFQAYIGTGLQWNMQQKTIGQYSLTTGTAQEKTIHQLSGNTAVGLNFFGPQKYMAHLNIGAKLHYTITDNDCTKKARGKTVDVARDRSCIVLCCGLTLDIDRRKNAALMLNYEYPLGTPRSDLASSGFLHRTQTFSLGLLFHIGGTRK